MAATRIALVVMVVFPERIGRSDSCGWHRTKAIIRKRDSAVSCF